MAPNGRPPIPNERKRALGNPGKRALPSVSNIVPLEGISEIPVAMRPLGQAGQALWDRAWEAGRNWLSPKTDIETLLIICEQLDERVALRIQVITQGDPIDRKALRDLDKQIMSGMSVLGFTPTDRARLGLAEVKAVSTLEKLRRKNG
jgi:hypothetical protein